MLDISKKYLKNGMAKVICIVFICLEVATGAVLDV